MKIIFAGSSLSFSGRDSENKSRKIKELLIGKYQLKSFFHIKSGLDYPMFRWCCMKENKVKLFLDSGAFSAWTQGIEINIQEYIDFIKENEGIIEVYANLDVIGIDGKQPNWQTAEKTLENQKIMERAGLSPIPCFHFGEPFKFLKYYVRNYEYIALGMAGNSGIKLIPWLDTCFGDYICREDGIPRVKVHGFAVTSFPIMVRYPWYSVDSTSWVQTGRMGSIFVPRWKDGKWVYNESPWKITVSNRSPKVKDNGQHINTFSPKQKQKILSYINEKGYILGSSEFIEVPQYRELANNERWAGKKPKNKTDLRLLEIIKEEGVANRYQIRDELNVIYFQDLEKSFPEWPTAFKARLVRGFNL